LVLREARYGGGDLLPRLVALRSVELFGGDGYLAGGHFDLNLVRIGGEVVIPSRFLGAPAADATISQLPKLISSPAMLA
jgi:hypothetical protein